MSKFGDAAFAVMKGRRSPMKSADLWAALQAKHPDLTTVTPTRKTPRTTCMRDLRKDARFEVGHGQISLTGDGRE